MCTAVGVNFDGFYFGRTLDIELSYGERVVVLPRRFVLEFKKAPKLTFHNAIIGMAVVNNGFPLLFDAANEKGLCGAALRFKDNAVYFKENSDKTNIAPFEVILWVLSLASSVNEAKNLIKQMNIVDTPFNEEFPNTPLHWFFADKNESIVVEQTKEGLFMYDNPFSVLTNNPPFPLMLKETENYKGITDKKGLPGDYSSISRFIRANFVKQNSYKANNKQESLSQFFHILDSVLVPKGCVILPSGELHHTVYTCAIDTENSIYYLKGYNDLEVKKVALSGFDLDGNVLFKKKIDKVF